MRSALADLRPAVGLDLPDDLTDFHEGDTTIARLAMRRVPAANRPMAGRARSWRCKSLGTHGCLNAFGRLPAFAQSSVRVVTGNLHHTAPPVDASGPVSPRRRFLDPEEPTRHQVIYRKLQSELTVGSRGDWFAHEDVRPTNRNPAAKAQQYLCAGYHFSRAPRGPRGTDEPGSWEPVWRTTRQPILSSAARSGEALADPQLGTG